MLEISFVKRKFHLNTKFLLKLLRETRPRLSLICAMQGAVEKRIHQPPHLKLAADAHDVLEIPTLK